ncbi:MAG: hypothetical protein E6K60_12545 [Nitrospirae bacterium]|nr:MAG: hypothetical protein E6K60_12545 [Nitrospirota bacterium]
MISHIKLLNREAWRLDSGVVNKLISTALAAILGYHAVDLFYVYLPLVQARFRSERVPALEEQPRE